MRVLVIGSCGKRKRFQSPEAPTCKDITDKLDLYEWAKKLLPLTCPAREMYLGNQARELGTGVDLLRTIKNIAVHYHILSAGFGFLDENDVIPPYECSFSTMRKSQIQERSRTLSIIEDFKKITSKRYDLSYIALGSRYLTALGPNWHDDLSGTIITFASTPKNDMILKLPADAETVKIFSSAGHRIHGIAGFKGDLLRILAEYALAQGSPYSEVVNWTSPEYLFSVLDDLKRWSSSLA